MMLPFVLLNNPFFKLIISELGVGDTAMSDTTLTTVLLPKTNKKVMDFVKSQLKDHEVCMIVDAMTRYDNSYSYFLVSCSSDKLVRGIEHHPTIQSIRAKQITFNYKIQIPNDKNSFRNIRSKTLNRQFKIIQRSPSILIRITTLVLSILSPFLHCDIITVE